MYWRDIEYEPKSSLVNVIMFSKSNYNNGSKLQIFKSTYSGYPLNGSYIVENITQINSFSKVQIGSAVVNLSGKLVALLDSFKMNHFQNQNFFTGIYFDEKKQIDRKVHNENIIKIK